MIQLYQIIGFNKRKLLLSLADIKGVAEGVQYPEFNLAGYSNN